MGNILSDCKRCRRKNASQTQPSSSTVGDTPPIRRNSDENLRRRRIPTDTVRDPITDSVSSTNRPSVSESTAHDSEPKTDITAEVKSDTTAIEETSRESESNKPDSDSTSNTVNSSQDISEDYEIVEPVEAETPLTDREDIRPTQDSVVSKSQLDPPAESTSEASEAGASEESETPSTSDRDAQSANEASSVGHENEVSNKNPELPKAETEETEEAGVGKSQNSEEESKQGSEEESKQNSEEETQETKQSSASIEEIVEKSQLKALEMKEQGNSFFGKGDYRQALDRYSEAILLSPDDDVDNKAVYHCNRAACYLMMAKTGTVEDKAYWESAVADCTDALGLKPGYPKALMRRGTAYEKLDQLSEAHTDYKAYVQADPTNRAVVESMMRIEPIVKERQEKQKEEMIGKLKELGDMVLGKFGMSVNDFKADKGPDGNYSISYQPGGKSK